MYIFYISVCSSVWLEYSPWKRVVVGSNPAAQTKPDKHCGDALTL